MKSSRHPLMIVGVGLLTIATVACDVGSAVGPEDTDVPPVTAAEADASDGTVAPSDSASEAADSATATTDTASTGAFPEEITGDTLFASANSGVLDARTTTLEDDAAWEGVWGELVSNVAQAPERPPVDFADQSIVLITMGQQSTGGYALEISALVVTEGSLTVRFVERVPGPTCINTQALTAPALALAVPRDAGSVEFEATRVVTDCG